MNAFHLQLSNQVYRQPSESRSHLYWTPDGLGHFSRIFLCPKFQGVDYRWIVFAKLGMLEAEMVIRARIYSEDSALEGGA
jgi:hypothetical protein